MSDKEKATPITPDEVDDIRVTLNTDDGDIECRPLTIFDVDGQDYIALMPVDEKGEECKGNSSLKILIFVSAVKVAKKNQTCYLSQEFVECECEYDC